MIGRVVSLPLVTIVTPSFNSGEFLEETIHSVLSQDYPRIEYIVMDGGSTDGTLAILERYRDRLQYVSQPDKGTADALNRGFQQSHGEILAWLSADDCYYPGAVAAAADRLIAEPDTAVVYGEGNWVDETGRTIRRYPTVSPYSPSMFGRECSICQPAAFFRRTPAEAVGMLDADLHSAFDYDLWIRLSHTYSFTAIPQYLATSRMHSRNKSLGQKGLMFEECIQLLQRYYGYVPLHWVYGYLSFLKDHSDQFYVPVRTSVRTYLRSLAVGSRYNSRHLFRYWGEWLSHVRP
jgi:glycosyltransferase involved in cell wall biosynthesis